MTVGELIKELSKLDPKLFVFTEGKHSYEYALDVFVLKEPKYTGHKKVCLITDTRCDAW